MGRAAAPADLEVLLDGQGGCEMPEPWGTGRFAGQLPTPHLAHDSALSLSLSESLNSLRKKKEQQPGEFFYCYYCSGILLQ